MYCMLMISFLFYLQTRYFFILLVFILFFFYSHIITQRDSQEQKVPLWELHLLGAIIFIKFTTAWTERPFLVNFQVLYLVWLLFFCCKISCIPLLCCIILNCITYIHICYVLYIYNIYIYFFYYRYFPNINIFLI